jgi:hypothetical protein
MESSPPCAGMRLRCNRSRADQLTEVDPRRADAARGSVSGLVSAAGGRARNPERLPELAGSGALLLKETASPMPAATTPYSARHSDWSCGGHHLTPRSATSSNRWMWQPYALRSVTGRSPRSLVAQRISISWCVTARPCEGRSCLQAVVARRSLPR